MDKYLIEKTLFESDTRKFYLVADKATRFNYYMEIVTASIKPTDLNIIASAFEASHTNVVKCHKIAVDRENCIVLMDQYQGSNNDNYRQESKRLCK